MSIESQGYDTLLAELSEKNWKQRSEQFLKRTKSESNRDLSLSPYLSLYQPTLVFFCLSCWFAPLKIIVDDNVSNFLFVLHWLKKKKKKKRSRYLSTELLLCSCCFDGVYKSTIYRICAHMSIRFYVHCQHERDATSSHRHENNLALIMLPTFVNLLLYVTPQKLYYTSFPSRYSCGQMFDLLSREF